MCIEKSKCINFVFLFLMTAPIIIQLARNCKYLLYNVNRIALYYDAYAHQKLNTFHRSFSNNKSLGICDTLNESLTIIFFIHYLLIIVIIQVLKYQNAV